MMKNLFFYCIILTFCKNKGRNSYLKLYFNSTKQEFTLDKTYNFMNISKKIWCVYACVCVHVHMFTLACM